MIRVVGCLTLSIGVLVMAGCAATEESPASASDESQHISIQQRKALADGDVTYDEYRAGFQEFSACMTRAGFPITELDEKNQIIRYSIPAAAVDAGEDEKCYNYHFQLLDIQWQIANEDGSETATVVRNCLVARGVTPEDSLDAMLNQLESINVTIDQCQ